VIIICISYFVGILWYIMVNYSTSDPNFNSVYDLGSGSEVSLTYFVFTSFSTVGLGDLHPQSSLERIVCAILLVFGVMMTSIVMDNFSLMLKQIKNFNTTFEDSVQLSLFMGTLKRFNRNFDLPEDLSSKIEKYF